MYWLKVLPFLRKRRSTLPYSRESVRPEVAQTNELQQHADIIENLKTTLAEQSKQRREQVTKIRERAAGKQSEL